VGSGDGYNPRFDAVLSDFERKERVTDDTIHYDDKEQHWWRTIQYLICIGQSGIILNPDKFQFTCRTVDFFGFLISKSSIEALPKYLDAIKNFPTPQFTTDRFTQLVWPRQSGIELCAVKKHHGPIQTIFEPKMHLSVDA